MGQTKTILSANQKKLLDALQSGTSLLKEFYLTGGTALAEFYLHHRYSEDLDFFSEQEIDPQMVFIELTKIKRKMPIKKIVTAQSFNRNLFFFHIGREVVKTEFTYFPFPRIENSASRDGIPVDSLIDIAANKLFTIYEHPRARDFIDLYCIAQETGWQITELIAKAKIKFDWHIDPVQLGVQFREAQRVKDYPRMVKRLSQEKWQRFFLAEAKKLKSDIFDKKL